MGSGDVVVATGANRGASEPIRGSGAFEVHTEPVRARLCHFGVRSVTGLGRVIGCVTEPFGLARGPLALLASSFIEPPRIEEQLAFSETAAGPTGERPGSKRSIGIRVPFCLHRVSAQTALVREHGNVGYRGACHGSPVMRLIRCLCYDGV
jgi:hypothetical protein